MPTCNAYLECLPTMAEIAMHKHIVIVCAFSHNHCNEDSVRKYTSAQHKERQPGSKPQSGITCKAVYQS